LEHVSQIGVFKLFALERIQRGDEGGFHHSHQFDLSLVPAFYERKRGVVYSFSYCPLHSTGTPEESGEKESFTSALLLFVVLVLTTIPIEGSLSLICQWGWTNPVD